MHYAGLRASILLGTVLLQALAPKLSHCQPDSREVGGVEPFELHARWHARRGLLGTGSRLLLRQLDEDRVSLRIRLPDHSLLPAEQFLLREGPALLHWQSPEGARSLLEYGTDLEALLSGLPPVGWAALISGRGLEDLIAGPREDRSGGWTRIFGDLGGHSVELRRGRGGAHSMDWQIGEGSYHFRWTNIPAGRSLRLRGPEGYKLRIDSRIRSNIDLVLEDWLFLSE